MGRRKTYEEKSLKEVRYQCTRYCGNLNVSSVSIKYITLSSQIQYALCTECEIPKDEIIKIIGIYNNSK